VRLRLLEEEYGDRVHMRFKAFLLRPHPQAGRKPGPDHPERWAKIAENGADVGIQFGVYPADRDLPTHSLPGLEAAKCAALQGSDAFKRMDLRLMEAYFGEGRDISDRGVLLELATESGLDVDKFQESFDSGALQPAVLAEDREAHERWGITAIPTVVFNNRRAIVGAVPMDQYRMLTEAMLSGRVF